MSDPNLSDFHGRVTRIKKARAKGRGFEAPGTLGRSHYTHPKAKRRAIVWPILFLVICTFLIKGAIYHEVGAKPYDSRAAALMAGQGFFDRIGGWLMQIDPLTLYVSVKIDPSLSQLK